MADGSRSFNFPAPQGSRLRLLELARDLRRAIHCLRDLVDDLDLVALGVAA